MESQEMTYGEKAVGITFNVDNDDAVSKIKRMYADIIDLLDAARKESTGPEMARLLSIAITEAQAAQMWAVKGVTYKY